MLIGRKVRFGSMRKINLFILFMLISSPVFADWCLYEETSGVIARVSTSQFNPDPSEIYSEVSCANGVDIGGKKWNGSAVVDATAQDLTDYQSAVSDNEKAIRKQRFIDYLGTSDGVVSGFKATAQLARDEDNLSKNAISEVISCISNGANLAGVKTCVDAIDTSGLSNRTNSQVLNAYISKMGTSDVD